MRGLTKTLRKAFPREYTITINIHSPLQQENKISSLLNQMTSHFQAYLTKKYKLEVVTQTATRPPFSKIICRDVRMARHLEPAELTKSSLPACRSQWNDSSSSFVDVPFLGFGSIFRFLLYSSKDSLYMGFYKQHYIGDQKVV